MSDSFSKELCEKEHGQIRDKLSHHERWLGEHEKKIDRLDRSDATNTRVIDDLCKQIASQTKAIWGLVSAVGLSLLGFFIWYVQSFPRGVTP